MRSLTSPTNVKKFALDVSEKHRAGKFKRVSQEALDRWEARLKSIIIDDIQRHPSVGITIK